MARWQLYTGLRISELLRLSVNDIGHRRASATLHHAIEVIRKGRKPGHVIAPASLLDETDGYVSGHRFAWLARARRKGRISEHKALFVNARGSPAGKNAYQRAVSQAVWPAGSRPPRTCCGPPSRACCSPGSSTWPIEAPRSTL